MKCQVAQYTSTTKAFLIFKTPCCVTVHADGGYLRFTLMSENKACHHHVQADYTTFYRNWKINVEVKYRDTFTPTSVLWHFTGPNFTTLTLAVRRYLHISCAEFNIDWLRNVEIKVRIFIYLLKFDSLCRFSRSSSFKFLY